MQYLISYDISSAKIRNKVVKYLESISYRVQYSVFLTPPTRMRMDTIRRHLEMLTQGSDVRRLLIITISDSVSVPLWSNEDLGIGEGRVVIV